MNSTKDTSSKQDKLCAECLKLSFFDGMLATENIGAFRPNAPVSFIFQYVFYNKFYFWIKKGVFHKTSSTPSGTIYSFSLYPTWEVQNTWKIWAPYFFKLQSKGWRYQGCIFIQCKMIDITYSLIFLLIVILIGAWWRSY